MTVPAIAAVTEVTAETSDTEWELHIEAARDLILIALDRASGRVIVPESQLSSRVRELCKLDNTTIVRDTISAALVLMERAKIVTRSTVDDKHVQLTLPRELSVGEIGNLVANEDETRKRLIAACERIQLFRSCRKGYGAVVKAADGAELKNEKGYVGLNLTGVLKGVGLIRSHAKQVHYYLRLLELVKSHGVCRKKGEGELHLYWWEVAVGKEVDVDTLTKLVDGNNSYEKEMARREEKRRRQEEDGPRERRHAGDVPAVLTDDMCSPVVVTMRQEPVKEVVLPVVTQNIETRVVRRPSPLDVPSRQPVVEPATEPDGDLLSEVVAIATRLEGERDRLIAEHAAELERREAKHATEVAGLNKVIDDLRQQLAARDSTSAAARELLARHRQA